MSDSWHIYPIQINLHLLLVDGKSHDFLFEPSVTASQIASHVFHNWPSGMYVRWNLRITDLYLADLFHLVDTTHGTECFPR